VRDPTGPWGTGAVPGMRGGGEFPMAPKAGGPMRTSLKAGQDSGMPQGTKAAYTDKQKRKAAHIEESYRERGVSVNEAEARAWATVNKQDGGGKKKRSATDNKKA
jgi:hypothetical protein